MRRVKQYALIVFLVAAGCQAKSPPADSTSAPIAAEPARSVSSQPNREQEGVLIVEPGFVTTCKDGDRTVATVKWQVMRPGVSTVRIEVNNESEPERKTFAMGGAVGEAITGNWVGKGVQFHLIDVASGDEIADYTVGLRPCPTPGA